MGTLVMDTASLRLWEAIVPPVSSNTIVSAQICFGLKPMISVVCDSGLRRGTPQR